MAGAGAAESETLHIGRAPRTGGGRRLRRGWAWAVVALGVVLLLLGGGLLLRRAWQPPPDITTAQLRDAYAGMVQGDGTSYLFPIDRTSFGTSTVTVGPPACRVLFATTVGGRFPDDAVDGVLAYWLMPHADAVELFTLRYPDAATARAAYASIDAAVPSCAGQEITVSDGERSGRVRVLDAQPGSVLPVPHGTRDTVRQRAYLLDLGDQGRYAISATQLRNTVTWQFRTDNPHEHDSTWAVQSLNDAFVVQLLTSVSVEPPR